LDRYHNTAPSMSGEINPTANSTLINGKGRYPGGPAVPLAVIEVEPFKRYRLRIISMSCHPDFTFSIDDHELLIIEADGENTEPLLVDSIQMFTGQRYSAILFADKPIGNYWVRAEPSVFGGLTGFAGGINSAILRYVGAPARDPETDMVPSIRPLRETDLSPLGPVKIAPGLPWPGGADVVLNLFLEMDVSIMRFKVNGVSWIPPSTPVLLQILSGARLGQDLLPKGSIYPLPPNKVIEISFSMTSGLGLVRGYLSSFSFNPLTVSAFSIPFIFMASVVVSIEISRVRSDVSPLA
jgi:iron transport multicopper oxidase